MQIRSAEIGLHRFDVSGSESQILFVVVDALCEERSEARPKSNDVEPLGEVFINTTIPSACLSYNVLYTFRQAAQE
jgi:hypothetical protein